MSVNLKTMLQSGRAMKMGKDYQGVLRRDVECEEFLYDEHFTFVETATHQTVRRNFRPMPMREDLTLERYALGVYNELCMALGGLVEEE